MEKGSFSLSYTIPVFDAIAAFCSVWLRKNAVVGLTKHIKIIKVEFLMGFLWDLFASHLSLELLKQLRIQDCHDVSKQVFFHGHLVRHTGEFGRRLLLEHTIRLILEQHMIRLILGHNNHFALWN